VRCHQAIWRRLLFCIILVAAIALPSIAQDLEKLKAQVAAQEQQINDQEREIEALRAALSAQRQLLQRAMGAASQATQPATPSATPQGRTALPPLNASQEVRFSESSPALKLGPADVHLDGYIALTSVYNSANVGGDIGTDFAAIPFPDTPEGNASEFRLSPQRTRVALRVDTKAAGGALAGYMEADFRGTTPGTVAVTSSSFGFRVRQAWVDYTRPKLQLSAGQMFSLMTPVRSEVTPNPGEAMMSYAVDAQYLAGLVWDRSPALRVAYRPNRTVTLAFALENPEQQVGPAVRFPKALASVLATQYNTGAAELRTPNLAPDLVWKGSFNFGPPQHRFHMDTGTVLRFFRNFDPARITNHKDARGVGTNLNFGVDLTSQLHMVLNGFASSGGGRYIGGLVPDVIVRPNGDISPIKAYSWVTGLEFAPSRRNMVFGYFSGAYAARNTAIDTDGSQIGFGFAGSNMSRRTIPEWTTGWSHLIWESVAAGSIQINTQYSYIRNYPWWAGVGPRFSRLNAFFGQLRYNLP
jgi:hypothetical protein